MPILQQSRLRVSFDSLILIVYFLNNEKINYSFPCLLLIHLSLVSIRLTSPAHPSQGGRGAGGGGFRGRGRGRGQVSRDRGIIGTTIKITQGPYKGHIGIVKVS